MQLREKLIIVCLAQGPGHVMYPGIHDVRYVASDAAGNRAECHFSIHVRGKFMPLCPAGVAREGLSQCVDANGVATLFATSLIPFRVDCRVTFFYHKYINVIIEGEHN